MQRRDLLLTMSLAIAVWDKSPAEAKVAGTDLASLVAQADLIIVAAVEKVTRDHGVKIAKALLKRSLKGSAPKTVYFVAQPTWECDMSEAVPGETVLVFLNAVKSQQVEFKGQPDRMGLVRARPLYEISHSGRGRIVVETVQGQSGATLYAHDVDVPKAIPRLKEKRTGSYLSWATVSLEALENAILREVKTQSQSVRK